MGSIKINILELKNIVAKINLAVERNKINPKAGWIELETTSEADMRVRVANYNYYLEANVAISAENYSDENKIHATIDAETFIPLVSKLESDYVEVSQTPNTVVLNTKTSEYTFAVIKELGKVKTVDAITFNPTHCDRYMLHGNDLASVADANVKGLVDALFTKDIQRFIYVDGQGAITFTENIYVNKFSKPIEITDDSPEFKFLLSSGQAKLLDVFRAYSQVELAVERGADYASNFKIKFSSMPLKDIELVLVVQSAQSTDGFPAIKLRQITYGATTSHVIIDKRTLDRALARLMIFDKKWDVNVLNYSKLVFGTDSVRLVSTKNKNYEVINYDESTDAVDHESIVRFADLTNQLKAAVGDKVDVSYGGTPAIVINSGNLCQMIPEIRERV